MTPSRSLRLLAALAAVAAIIAGRLALADQAWLDWLVGLLRLRGSNALDFFPGVIGPGHIAALTVATLGCALLAWTLPPISGGRTFIAAPHSRSGVPRGDPSRRSLAIFALALLLAATAAILLRRAAPGALGAWLWLTALLVSAAAAWSVDRARGTSFGNPLPERRDVIAVAALVVFDLLLVGHDITHWAWAGTPDEGNFFPFAREIARGKSSHFILSETGMYNVHPLLSSHWQALFMRAFGLEVFGWRLSSAAALALSLPFVYVIGRELWSRRFGLWAAVLFGTAPLAVGFSHFGYNNSQIYLFITGAPAAFLWARRRQSALGYWLAGAWGGLAVFTFYPARMALPLVFILAFALRERPWAPGQRGLWAVLLIATLVAATPCLVHPLESFDRMSGQTFFSGPEAGTPAPLTQRLGGAALAGKGGRIARHWLVSVLHPLWYPRPSHFQTQSVIDPLQGALALTGFFFAWRSFRRHAGCRFLALAYSISALAVGAVSQHDCPPLTRLLFLCPFTALLAVLALQQLVVPLGSLGGRRSSLATALGSAAVIASAAWGFGILRYNVYVRHHGYGEGTTSEVLRLAAALPPDWRIVFVQRWPSYMQSVDSFAAAYGFENRVVYLRQSPEVAKHLPTASAPHFVFVHDLPEGDTKREVESMMQERFPGRAWQESAPGQKWNLRVLGVGGEGGEWQVPPLPERGEAGRVLFGHLDR